MKKKSLVSLCLALLFSLFLFAFKGTDLAFAEETPTEEFSITYSADTGFSVNSTEQNTSWSEVLSYIEESTPDGSVAKLNFNSVTLAESLELSGADLILTGTLTSTASPIFNITSANNFSLTDLTLTGAEGSAIEVSSDTPATITLSNLTVTGTQRVMDFTTTNHTVNFAGTITLTPEETIFAEFVEGLNFNVTGDIYDSSLLTLLVPYDANNLALVTYDSEFYNGSYSAERFVAKSKDEQLYTVTTRHSNSNPIRMYATSTVKFEYDANGGSVPEDYANSFVYKNNFTFLSAEAVTKNYHTFDGWFIKYALSAEEKVALDGQISPDTEYLFVDTTSLQEYIASGKQPSSMLTYFAESVDDVKNRSGRITAHVYSAGDADNVIKFLIENNQKIVLTAKWTKKLYTLTFNSTGGSRVDSMTRAFGEAITAPTAPTRTGHTFVAWCEDEGCEQEFHFDVMPHENKTLYAKWQANTHSLTLHLDGAEYESQTDTYTSTRAYGTELNLPVLSKVGYNFIGWFEDAQYSTPASQITMPDRDVELYAKFERQTFKVYFNDSNIVLTVSYGDHVSRPANPERVGYLFLNWYTTSTFEQEFDFEHTVITAETHIYARWLRTDYQYTIDYRMPPLDPETRSVVPGTLIEEPTIPGMENYENYIFRGWYTDIAYTRQVEFPYTMPSSDLTIYARWERKQEIVLDLKKQEYDYDDFGVRYKDFDKDNLGGFTVWYRVDGEWTTNSPQKTGTYDIRITRAADNNYASFEMILDDGLKINYAKTDISLYITFVFILFGIELFAIILLKIMKKRKTSKVYAMLPIVVAENTIIPNSQFILLLVACGLTLLGFIYLIYLIVDVHRTAKNESFLPSNLDNRERFKDELEFQNKNQGDDDYETKPKTEESFGSKYSAMDISRLLEKDTFKEETLAKRKFNVEDNSSINWNEVSTNKGSDIIARSKDFGDLANGRINNRTPVKFFDEDEEEESGSAGGNGETPPLLNDDAETLAADSDIIAPPNEDEEK